MSSVLRTKPSLDVPTVLVGGRLNDSCSYSSCQAIAKNFQLGLLTVFAKDVDIIKQSFVKEIKWYAIIALVPCMVVTRHINIVYIT